jgi:hypothetical protein
MKTDPNPMPFFLHEDMDFISTVLRLRVSFKWRPLIGKNVTDTIKQWAESPPSIRPYWILLSTSSVRCVVFFHCKKCFHFAT